MLSPLDYVLLQLGSPGRYQLFVAFLILCLQLPISFTNNLWKYYADEPPHRCLIEFAYANGTAENEWIPTVGDGKSRAYSSCVMYIDAHNHWKGTQKCVRGWEYRPVEDEHNVIIEYDLVCERKYLATVLFNGSLVSAMIGALLFGMLADHWERKRSLLLALYLFIAAAFSLHFVQDFLSFAICYSLQACFITGVHIASYVLLVEIFPTPYQLQASLHLAAFGIASTMLLPLLMWLIKTWRYVQLAVSAPGVVFLAHVWLLPQSPLWLIVEGRVHATENLVERLAHQNGKSVPPSFRLHLQNLYNSVKGAASGYQSRHRILPKFSSPCLRWYILVHFYLFFVVGLSMDVTESHVLRLNESKYADHFYRGLIDLGSIMLVYYFAVRLGPRSVQSILFILAGLLMMGSITLQEMLPKPSEGVSATFDYRLLLLPSTLVSGAKTLMKTLPAFVWYHAVKTLPTGIRGVGFASCVCWMILGQMAAPHLLVLADLIAPFIPIGLCGSLSVIAGGLSLLFPNCWRRPLPNTLDEAENRALVPAKGRYPSFRDIKNGKFDTLQSSPSTTMSNVYTLPPTYPKMDPKYEERLARNGSLNEVAIYNVTQQDQTTLRPTALYNDDTDSRLSDLEDEIENGNWRLYSHQLQAHDAKERDMHVFSNATRAPLDQMMPSSKMTHAHRVAETNL